MIYQIRNPRFYVVFCIDLCLVCLSLFLAYLIRFDFELRPADYRQMSALLALVVPLKLTVFFLYKLYRGMFRYAGLAEMWRIAKAVILSSLVVVSAVLVLSRFQGFSRGVFIIDTATTFLLIGGFRLSMRLVFQYFQNKNGVSQEVMPYQRGVPTLIIGAGTTGEKILREISTQRSLYYNVVGFIDDDPGKQGRSIHDITVLGTVAALPGIVRKHEVGQVLIAAPSASGRQIRTMVDACKAARVPFKTLPGLAELIDGKVSIKTLRDVNYRDLLRRDPVRLNVPEIESYLKDRRVLVTGAGGSIGSELCRQIVRFTPENLILFDASEPNLYGIEMELKHRVGYQKYVTVLGGVQDKALVERVMRRYRPHVIFHAAAYKHVPMLERNPWQAVTNNIMGTRVLMESAVKHGVGHFVMVSTDKAVRPTNVMGASKRVCELIGAACSGGGTRMMTVRFGNVVNSAGSVVPLFREQIARGGPVTITHPEVTRFFMTIPEAAQLVLQAGALGEGGETFILDMGTPVKIVDMARDLIRLSGKEPDTDVEIVFTGLREGEKLYEELITRGEGIVATAHEKIMVLKAGDDWDGLGGQEPYRDRLTTRINELAAMAQGYDGCAIRLKIQEIVPEYDLQDSECIL